MFGRSRRPTTGNRQYEPSTLIGTFLLNAVFDRRELRKKYQLELSERVPLGGFEQAQVATVVLRSFMRRFFAGLPTEENIDIFIDGLYRDVPVDLIQYRNESTAVVKSTVEGLNELVVGVSKSHAVEIRMTIIGMMVRRLNISEAEVCKAIVAAERELIAQGVPLLAL